MFRILKPIAAVLAGVTVLGIAGVGVSTASAEYRPDYCPVVHDHRAHQSNYYNYYPADSFFRASPRGISVTLHTNDRRYNNSRYDNRRNYDRARNNRRNRGQNYDRRGYRNANDVVKRQTFNTRFRARIVLKEKIVYGRRGDRLVCSVSVRGPEAEYVPYRRLKRVANNNCSPRARVSIRA